MNLASTCYNDRMTGQFSSSALIFFSFLGERLLSDYAVQPSLRYQVKQLRDDVNAKLEDVRPSPVSVASVLEDKKKLDQQLIEGGTKLPEDASSESLGK